MIISFFSLPQFSCSVVSNSLQPHGLQHTRLPCISATPGACSHTCPLSQWCHPTISSSVIPFSSCLQSFPLSGSFPMSQFFASGGQSIEASASVLPMNITLRYLLKFPLRLRIYSQFCKYSVYLKRMSIFCLCRRCICVYSHIHIYHSQTSKLYCSEGRIKNYLQ